jgi:DNA repair protein RecO (recombination protein O)
MVEILSKTLKEQTQNQQLFDFIWRSILQFDDEVYPPENFHLIFLIKLTRFLGFNPRNSYELFEELKSELDHNWVNSTEANRMNQLLSCDYLNAPPLNNKLRMDLLNILLSLYRLHVEQFGMVKSVKILHQVFS